MTKTNLPDYTFNGHFFMKTVKRKLMSNTNYLHSCCLTEAPHLTHLTCHKTDHQGSKSQDLLGQILQIDCILTLWRSGLKDSYRLWEQKENYYFVFWIC